MFINYLGLYSAFMSAGQGDAYQNRASAGPHSTCLDPRRIKPPVPAEYFSQSRALLLENSSNSLRSASTKRLNPSDSSINFLENNRRRYSALSICPDRNRANIDSMFEAPMTWLCRGDDTALKEISQKDHFSALVDEDIPWSQGIDMPGAMPHHIHGRMNFVPVYSHYTVKQLSDKPIDVSLATGLTVPVTPNQSREMLKIISELSIINPLDKNEPYFSPDDHLSLWVKNGVEPKAFKAQFIEQTGRIGWHIFQYFLTAQEEKGVIKHDTFPAESLAINMAEWRDRYVQAALKKADIVQEFSLLSNNHPGSYADIYDTLLKKLEQKTQALIKDGEIGSLIYQFDLFKHLLSVESFNHLARASYQGNQAVKNTQPDAPYMCQIRKAISLLPKSTDVNAMLYAFDNQLFQLKLLPQKEYQKLILSTFGRDKSSQVAGLAQGACIFVKLTHEDEQKLKKSGQLSLGTLSTCIHELRHALDWLRTPEQFNQYNIDSLSTYSLERRAFHIQNELQRQLAATDAHQGSSIRFSHSKAIRQHILDHYPRSRTQSQFNTISQSFEQRTTGKH